MDIASAGQTFCSIPPSLRRLTITLAECTMSWDDLDFQERYGALLPSLRQADWAPHLEELNLVEPSRSESGPLTRIAVPSNFSPLLAVCADRDVSLECFKQMDDDGMIVGTLSLSPTLYRHRYS